MVGMMVCAVVVVCAAADHNVDSHVDSSYTRPSCLVSNNYRFSQTRLLIAVRFGDCMVSPTGINIHKLANTLLIRSTPVSSFSSEVAYESRR
jgi:hypothetical protein